MLRKSLFLILTLALLGAPVFLLAHAFTHYAQTGEPDIAGSRDEAGIDLDEICFDCVALTALNFILIVAKLLLSNTATRRRLPAWEPACHANSTIFPYFSRAPPFRLF